jgi:hypothetical protein
MNPAVWLGVGVVAFFVLLWALAGVWLHRSKPKAQEPDERP